MSRYSSNDALVLLMLLGGIFVGLMVVGFVIEFWPVILVGLVVLAVATIAAKS